MHYAYRRTTARSIAALAAFVFAPLF